MQTNHKLMDTKKKEGQLFRHRNYLESVADKIHKSNPTKEIIYNTLLSVFKTATTWGWNLRLNERKIFKNKINQHKKESFNAIKDQIDDQIHSVNK